MWAEIASIAGGSGITVGGAFAAVSHWLRGQVETIVQDTNRPMNDRLSAMELSLATQFGGNGGGMRQAINELQVDLAEVKGKVDTLGKAPQ